VLCGFGVYGILIGLAIVAEVWGPHIPEIIEVIWAVVYGFLMWVVSFTVVQYIIAGLLIRWTVADMVEDGVRAAMRKN
jgi:hypothetical protein